MQADMELLSFNLLFIRSQLRRKSAKSRRTIERTSPYKDPPPKIGHIPIAACRGIARHNLGTVTEPPFFHEPRTSAISKRLQRRQTTEIDMAFLMLHRINQRDPFSVDHNVFSGKVVLQLLDVPTHSQDYT